MKARYWGTVSWLLSRDAEEGDPTVSRPSETGQGLIAAIFVIVVLAMLGTALVRILATEERASGREMASAYAFYAAESTAQWGMYQLIARGNSTFGGTQPLTGPAEGLAECGTSQVTGNVQRFGTVNVPGGKRDLFRFEVMGTCFPGRPELTRRELEMRFSE